MKYLKTLAVAAVALMAFASSASATHLTVTTENGIQDQVPFNSTLTGHLEAGTEATLKSSFIGEVKCAASTIAGRVTRAGSATETVAVEVTELTFTSCNGTVTVLKKGTLEIHTEKEVSNGNGTLTSNGAEVTVELAGLHCIFTTSNTDVGQVKGTHSGSVEAKAESAPIPRTGGRSGAFCGSSATWNAAYTITHVVFPAPESPTFESFTVV